MTEFEKAKSLQIYYAGVFGQCAIYGDWDADFVKKQIVLAYNSGIGEIGFIDFIQLTEAQLSLIGAKPWSEFSELMLLPVWTYRHLMIGMPVITITGEELTVGVGYTLRGHENYLDNDQRFNCLAFGVIPAKKKETTE